MSMDYLNRNLSYEATRLLQMIEKSGLGESNSTQECNCGRIHYANESNQYDWEEGEFESYEKDENYHYYDDDSVYSVDFFGKTFVVGCECRALDNMASLIWGERKTILSYIQSRHEYNKVFVLETESMLEYTSDLRKKLKV